MIVKIGVYRLGTCACEIISWITHIMEVWSIQLREAELCLRLQHPREGTRLVPRAQPEGLVWFLPEGVVIKDTAKLRGAV